jgi:hypothetical protein
LGKKKKRLSQEAQGFKASLSYIARGEGKEEEKEEWECQV